MQDTRGTQAVADVITSAPAARPPDVEVVAGPAGQARRVGDTALLTGLAAAGVVVALVLARSTGLWLDEAQSVAIARQSLSGLLDALRHDGSPPLYYLLLHGWSRLFGTGDTAVRALSGLFAVATVPALMTAARRTLGPRGAFVTGAVAVSAPFFYRYATEARMYSLVFLLVAVGLLLLERAWRAPTAPVLAGLALTSGLFALTHYWGLFLLAPLVGWLAWRRRWPLAAALAGGGVLFLPWLPSFVYQSTRTGAPWGPPADPGVYEFSLRGFAGGPGRLGALGLLYFGLALLAVIGRVRGDDVVVDVRGTVVGRRLALTVLVPLTVGMAVSAAAHSAFAVRYAAIVFVPFALLVAYGVDLVRPAHLVRYVLAAVVVFGAWRSVAEVHARRTQARSIAAVLNEQAQAGDVVVFCPDQLGPAITRLLHTPAATSAYPTGASGEIVDWVDYKARNKAAHPEAFAQAASASTGGAVWYVMANGYRTFSSACARIYDELDRLRPENERVLRARRSAYERGALWRFPATVRGAS
ncbi:MAG TPA: glycosyltransferase family 39 protein [Acidimicrobiales bacterium]|jgi:hypothetical protein|nr:glycosyltransferase family 39 protein [Acidimicrobiales bacterium]